MRRRIAAGVLGGLAVLACTSAGAQGDSFTTVRDASQNGPHNPYHRQVEDGWTDFTPDTNTRIYYVSSSEGSDSNSGRSPQSPFRTLEQAYEMLRDGQPDWLLLKRGDVWMNEPFPMWKKSGESRDAKMLIGTYGEGRRPILRTGDQCGIRFKIGQPVSHIAIVGIEFHAHQRNGDESVTGIEWQSSGGDLLIEDCYVHHYKDNIIIQDGMRQNGVYDITIRRSVITDSFCTDSHSQGIFFNHAHNVLVEENLLDHNGWNEDVAGAHRTIFNHNIYVQNMCSNVTVRDNIIARGSSHGVQMRPGGNVVRNVFSGNAISVLMGGGDYPNSGGVSGQVRRNVIMSGTDIARDLPRAHAITAKNIRSLAIKHNMILRDRSAESYGHAIYFDGSDRDEAGVRNVNIINNTIVDWRGGIKYRGTPGRDLRNFRVEDNRIQDSQGETSLIRHEDDIQPDEFDYAGNTYHSTASSTSWYRIDNVNYHFDQWRAQAEEDNAHAQRVIFVDSARSLDRFSDLVTGSADEAVFFERLRDQQRGSWRSGYTAEMLLQYFEEGFAPDPSNNGGV